MVRMHRGMKSLMWEFLEPSKRWAHHRNENEVLQPRIEQAMNCADGGNGDVTRCDAHRLARFIDLILANTRDHGPRVLTTGMHVRMDALPWFDRPGDNDSVRRFTHDRANGRHLTWLQVISHLKNSLRHLKTPACFESNEQA
jgi:hypothetical protein